MDTSRKSTQAANSGSARSKSSSASCRTALGAVQAAEAPQTSRKTFPLWARVVVTPVVRDMTLMSVVESHLET
jgi:hypothetical protein